MIFKIYCWEKVENTVELRIEAESLEEALFKAESDGYGEYINSTETGDVSAHGLENPHYYPIQELENGHVKREIRAVQTTSKFDNIRDLTLYDKDTNEVLKMVRGEEKTASFFNKSKVGLCKRCGTGVEKWSGITSGLYVYCRTCYNLKNRRKEK